jgi:hypothetical protein
MKRLGNCPEEAAPFPIELQTDFVVLEKRLVRSENFERPDSIEPI